MLCINFILAKGDRSSKPKPIVYAPRKTVASFSSRTLSMYEVSAVILRVVAWELAAFQCPVIQLASCCYIYNVTRALFCV